jgi:hypothetical protein
MSRLYSSPEVISFEVFSLEVFQPLGISALVCRCQGLPLPCRFIRCGTRYAHRIAVQPDSRKILPFVAVNKDAFPSSPAYAAGCNQIT